MFTVWVMGTLRAQTTPLHKYTHVKETAWVPFESIKILKTKFILKIKICEIIWVHETQKTQGPAYRVTFGCCRFVDLYDSFIAERLFKSSILRSLFVIIPQILQGIYCHSKSTNEDDKVHRS